LSGNYTTTLTVAATTTPVLSVPNFARGPGQSVAITDSVGNATGIPVDISNAANVTQASFTLTYDPTLLTIGGSTALSLSAAAFAAGLSISSYSSTSEDAHHSVLTVDLSGGTGLTATTAETLLTIAASVPDTAPYLNKAVLNLGSVVVNGANGSGVSGVDVSAYLGNVSGSGSLSSLDASLVSQVGDGSGSGFSEFKDLDPNIVGAVGDSSLSALDASLINEAGVGSVVSQIPTVPGGINLITGGPDPYLYLSAVQGSAGQTVTETLYLDVTDPNGIQLTALDEAIGFDANALQISDIRSGSGLAVVGSYSTMGNVDNGSGMLLVGQAFEGSGLPPVVPYGTDVPVLQFDVTLNANMSLGSETGLTLLQDGTINGQTKYTAISDNEGALTWTPGREPSNRGNPAIDGSVSVVPPATPAVVETVSSHSPSPAVGLSRVVEPLRRLAPTVATATNVSTASALVVTAAPTEDLVVISAGALAPPPPVTMQLEANPAINPIVDAQALASEAVQAISLVPVVPRITDPGASLSVAALGTSKFGTVVSPGTSSVKASTTVLDEMYRQFDSLPPISVRNGYDVATGGTESVEEVDEVWGFEEMLGE
jgi:hypothetical protein